MGYFDSPGPCSWRRQYDTSGTDLTRHSYVMVKQAISCHGAAE